MIAFLACIASVAIVVCVLLALRLRQAQRWNATLVDDHTRFENAIRHNLRMIRARVDYAFPDVTGLCNRLEASLSNRCILDLEKIEGELIAHRRAHNARLLDAADSHRTRARLRDILTQIESAAFSRGLEGVARHAKAGLSLLGPTLATPTPETLKTE